MAGLQQSQRPHDPSRSCLSLVPEKADGNQANLTHSQGLTENLIPHRMDNSSQHLIYIPSDQSKLGYRFLYQNLVLV